MKKKIKNKFKKLVSRDRLNIKELVKKENFIKPFSRNDFDSFLLKLYGNFIFRGKKSYSLKIYNYLLLNLKKKLKKNPILIFMQLIKILIPFLILSKKTYKGKSLFVPMFANKNKKNILMINWLIKQFKGRSFKNGINKDDVLNILIETYKNKGSAVNLKKDHYIEALKNRRNIRTKFFYYKLFKRRKIKEKINKLDNLEKLFFKHHEWNESKIFWYNYKKYNLKKKYKKK